MFSSPFLLLILGCWKLYISSPCSCHIPTPPNRKTCWDTLGPHTGGRPSHRGDGIICSLAPSSTCLKHVLITMVWSIAHSCENTENTVSFSQNYMENGSFFDDFYLLKFWWPVFQSLLWYRWPIECDDWPRRFTMVMFQGVTQSPGLSSAMGSG